MRRRLLLFLIFLTFTFGLSTPLLAQGGFTTVTGTITDPNGVKWSCGSISAQLITAGGTAPTLNGGGFSSQTSPVQLGCPTIPGSGANGSFAMRLADSGVISPGTTTWKFTVNTTGNAPPLGTGPQSFTYTSAINCSTNTPSTCTSNTMDISSQLSALAPALGGSGGGSASGGPIPNTVIPGTINPYSSAYGVKGNWQSETNGANFTVTSGSNIVTCTTCKFQTSTYHPAAVGDDLFSTTWTGGDTSYPSGAAVIGHGASSPVTITSVDSDTQVHFSTNASGNAGTTNGNNGTLQYGTDDDAALRLATTAAFGGLVCNPLQLGGGMTNINGAIWNTSLGCRGISGGSTASHYQSVIGVSPHNSTTVVIPPWFQTTNCTAGADSIGCVGPSNSIIRISFNGFGACSDGLAAKTFLETSTDMTYQDDALWGWGCNASSLSNGFVANAGAHEIRDIQLDGFAGTPITVTNAFLTDIFAGNNGANAPSIQVNGTAVCVFCSINIGGSGVGVNLASNAVYRGIYDSLAQSSALASNFYQLGAGAKAWLYGVSVTNTGNANSNAIAVFTGSGAFARVEASTLAGGGTGAACSVTSTNTCLVDTSNQIPSGPVYVTGGGALTIAATGFGTGTIALNAGVNTAYRTNFTITPAGAPAATGTVTLTFNQTVAVNGQPPACQLQFGNGTESWTAPVTVLQSTVSTTSYAWAWTAGAAPGTTGTLIGSIQCQPD